MEPQRHRDTEKPKQPRMTRITRIKAKSEIHNQERSLISVPFCLPAFLFLGLSYPCHPWFNSLLLFSVPLCLCGSIVFVPLHDRQVSAFLSHTVRSPQSAKVFPPGP